jgi:hypothetical protein
MDLISVDVRGLNRQQQTTARIDDLARHWKSHENKLAEVQEHRDSGGDEVIAAMEARQDHTPIYIALPVVLDRSLRNTWRQQDLFWTR